MKVVILAGGLGTRISEYTKLIPKPMIEVCKKPLIYFIMKHYANYGFKDFYAGVPVIVGKDGIEKIIEINLSSEEKINFNNSIKSVQELCDAAKKIDTNLI